MSPEQHLDLDALADVLTGEPSLGAEEHVAGCARCRTALSDLRAAQAEVAGALAALAAPAMPADVAGRLHDALRTAAATAGGATTTVTPFPRAESRPGRGTNGARWLPAAAAAVVLLGGAGFVASRLGGGADGSRAGGSATAAKSAPELAVERNSSGADYTDRASLAAAVADLLAGKRSGQDSSALSAQAPAGTAQQKATAPTAAPDPLARLRGKAGLADCLLALLPPDDPSVQPLALDYAAFRRKPAMVVVLPGAAPNKLDIFVVGPACSRANDSVLFYTSVDRP